VEFESHTDARVNEVKWVHQSSGRGPSHPLLSGRGLNRRKLIPPVPHQPLVYLAALLPVFALSLLISAVLFILIEKPFSLRPQQVQADNQNSSV
jgi:hypothetical protein